MDLKTLVIVSCGAKKIWDKKPDTGPTPAKDAYTGNLFKLSKRYAQQFADKWVVLSAKYGFVDPDFLIPGNYDVSFKLKGSGSVSIEELETQVEKMGLRQFDRVVVLGGKEYANRVVSAFGWGVTVENPLGGLGIGKMQRKLRQAIDSGRPFS